MNIKQIVNLLKATFSAWVDDHASSMGAALAYYTIFSIAPILLIIVSVAGLIFDIEVVRIEIHSRLEELMGESGALVVQDLLAKIHKPSESIFAASIGLIFILIGATSVLAELQSDLDTIWRVPKRTNNSGVIEFIHTRLISFGLILGVGFILIISLILSTALAALGKWWGHLFSGFGMLAYLLDIVLSITLMTAIFAMIYKLMPRTQINWQDVWIGAVVTAIFFTIGKFLIGLYIGRSSIASGFGAAGSLVVVLVWIYYSAQIFLLGAEFTRIYSYTLGSRRSLPMQAPATPSEKSSFPVP